MIKASWWVSWDGDKYIHNRNSDKKVMYVGDWRVVILTTPPVVELVKFVNFTHNSVPQLIYHPAGIPHMEHNS